jgi:hypothetical protein
VIAMSVGLEPKASILLVDRRLKATAIDETKAALPFALANG